MALHFFVSVAAPVVSVVTKIGEYLVAPVGRQFGYLIFYDRNIKNFKKQVQKLEDKRVGTQLLVDAAKRNTEIIGPDVERWLTEVDELGKEANKFLEDEVKANKECLNLKSRYSLSRKAKKKTQDVVEVCADGNFPRVSYPAPPAGIASIPTGDFKGFESRRSIMNEVMEALADDSINMIGICGMGGVGKTTLVKEVANKAKERNLFDEDVMVVVSQNPDLIKIQGEIAEMLHLKFFGNISLLERANELRTRISSSKRILVILDDVWKRLELNDIGIPFGNDHKGCKIVLTSRSEGVCNYMGTQKKIKVQVLNEEEAWNLFKEVAGIASDVISTTTDLHSIQKAVAKECGGLPIAILTVGRALYGKEKPSWDDALNQLQKALGNNIEGVDEMVFRSLELSYSYLREEAKKLFLLCSLFPEDFRIQIEGLVRYGIGLKLFEGIGTVGDARNRVYDLVDGLMKCYLLMDDKKKVSVRMHDVIRDVAISIASRKEHSFMVRCDEALKEWSEEDRHESYTAISLKCTAMRDLPDNLELPNLKLLRLQYSYNLPETPDCFYQGMKDLKVVTLSNMYVQSLPASLRCLTNLRTLSLHYCLLNGDISVIGALKNLEILSFTSCYGVIEELPKEISNLTRLKLLELTRCQVKRISPGVLSSLSRLEELYVGKNVQRWSVPSLSRLEEEEKEKELYVGDNVRRWIVSSLSRLEEEEKEKELYVGDNVRRWIVSSLSRLKEEEEIISDATTSITELASLSNLVALDIHIEFWPKDFVLEKVKKFRISVGEYVSCNSFDSYLLKNQLSLGNLDASDVMESGIKMLLKSTEILKLCRIAGLKNILCDSCKDIFEYLKELSVEQCTGLEYLNKTTTDDDDDDGVVSQRAFPVLEVLKLRWLNNFKGIIYDGRQQLAKKKKKEVVELQNLPQIPHHNKIGGPTQLDWFCNLTSVKMENCDTVESLFALSMARGLVQLRTLNIIECKMMESIVSSGEGGRGGGGEHEITIAATDHIEFPKLQELFLSSLRSLIAFCKVVNAIELPQLNKLTLFSIPKLRSLCYSTSESNYATIIRPLFNKKSGPTQLDGLRNLTSVEMRRCDMVESMFSLSMARGLVQLQTLYIDECEVMESIVCSSEGGGEHEITAAEDPMEFPKLQKLTLTNLPSFIAFCKVVNAIELPQLNELDLTDIPKLKSLCHTASESNCDTIIQPLFNKVKLTTSFDKLSLSGMDNLIEIWPRELKVKLRELRVYMCHGLLSSTLFPYNLIECLQNLELFELKACRSVEVAFDLGGLIVREGHPAVALLSLKYLELIHLPKLTHVWMNNNSPAAGIQGFNNLTSLKVKGCDNLRNLFSSSLAKLLVNLQKLEITECVGMEAIIAKEQRVDDDDEVTTTTNTIIMFPQLTSLKLSALPNLMSFCPQGYTFERSFLKNVQVINCPKMEALPSEFQQVQVLKRSNEGFHETVQKIDEAPRKFMLTNEREFTVMEIDDATELWQNQLEAECLHDVKRMWVQCCGKLSSVVSISLIQKFHNLKQLKVWWCYSVGVIFDLEGVCADEGTITQLSEMEFKYLPKLTDIWKINFSQQTHCFQNLRSLKVKRCDSLKYIFTLSMAKVLVNLESLKVGHCENVEKIIIREEEEEEEEEEEVVRGETILPTCEWESVRLKDLPSFVSFGVPFGWWRLKLQSCPKFQHD